MPFALVVVWINCNLTKLRHVRRIHLGFVSGETRSRTKNAGEKKVARPLSHWLCKWWKMMVMGFKISVNSSLTNERNYQIFIICLAISISFLFKFSNFLEQIDWGVFYATDSIATCPNLSGIFPANISNGEMVKIFPNRRWLVFQAFQILQHH